MTKIIRQLILITCLIIGIVTIPFEQLHARKKLELDISLSYASSPKTDFKGKFFLAGFILGMSNDFYNSDFMTVNGISEIGFLFFDGTVKDIFGVSEDVTLTRIPIALGLRVFIKATKSIRPFIGAGPELILDWYSTSSSSNDSGLKFGLFTEAGVMFLLDRSRSFFITPSFRYNFIENSFYQINLAVGGRF